MADLDSKFAGSIPEIYDRYLGPMLFQPYAEDLAARISDLAPRKVLETAAGTGIVTRAVLTRLREMEEIVATDLNMPMLQHAARKTASSHVTWRQADATALPFETATFDAVICQFGVMFFPQKEAAYREASRVLKPGGRFIFNVWGAIADNDFTTATAEAVAALFPEDPPSFFARVPHGYHDTATVRDEVGAAGFTAIRIETIRHTSVAATPRDAAIGLCQGTPLRNEIEARDPTGLEDSTKAAAGVLAARFGSGRIEGRLVAHIVEATK